ncbi:MAG: GDP-L-fucose synthase [Deltaproteobacteria bacterium]|nr:MAG: GDP-L-fucose synthase [Deltaproteobacteria bacterium]
MTSPGRKTRSSAPGAAPGSPIFIAGHKGMVGSAVMRRLRAEGYDNIITRTHRELDLTDQQAVRNFFRKEKIGYVILAAARVGGIHANNTYPAEFIYQNLMIECNIIHQAFSAGIRDLLFLGSSCIYPAHAPQPIKEEHLLTGTLEPTNEPYAIAKIAGIKLCESYNRQYGTRYCSLMPTNLYGPNDNYSLENSHVLPAMIRKFHLAKLAAKGDIRGIRKDEDIHGRIPGDIRKDLGLGTGSPASGTRSCEPVVRLWGSGSPRREFLHADDLADACLFIMNVSHSDYEQYTRPMLSHLNVGMGQDMAIRELAVLTAGIVGYNGPVIWDDSRPDGTPRKLLDVSRMKALGWTASISLRAGITAVYGQYEQ